MTAAMRYAKVIVDVPAKATDRAFDYMIPDRWEGIIEIGSRVGVPFGPRVLQGFVVEIHDQTEVDADKLKPIAQVMDLVPPLTPELIQLGRWMSKRYLCPAIIALQAMIPGALKAKYERFISLAPGENAQTLERLDELEQSICAYVAEKGQLPPEAIIDGYPGSAAVLKRLVKQGVLLEVQTVKDRLKVKRILTVFPPDHHAPVANWLTKLPANARRQKEVLTFLAEQKEPIALTALCAELGVNPSTVKALAERGWIAIREQEVLRDPYAGRSFARTSPLPLTAEQAAALAPIVDALSANSYARFLLHGVTGSGKTEVYLQAIDRCLEQGREAIVLVPEISLTPQMVDRFKGRFGDQVAVLHSRLSHGERYDEWRKIQRRQVSVVVGARSAIFAPFANLGLIIIDEEHESSYKQEESPKYTAKEAALERAKQHDAVVVLGSATPSLESYAQAMENSGSLRLLAMPTRVGGQAMPKVHLIDMRDELKGGNRTMFSRALHQAIVERLARQEQIVLLLNRRGYATFVLCRSCGYTASCPHCDIALTYHQRNRTLRCHYCGYAERESKSCPACGSEHIRHFGTGTQRVEEELNKQFPGIRVIRMDVDTTGEKGAHEKWLTKFRDKEADVLLGTQMVAKGLDFPDVTLVGVLAADSVLHLPDFRAVEKTFQLVTQVAGRAGRHKLAGEVIVQTYNPEHYSMQAAADHDYIGFARQELEYRRQLGYPPYSRLVLLTLSHEEQTLLMKTGETTAQALREIWMQYARKHHLDFQDLSVLGPVPSPIPKLKDRYRFQCMVKYRGKLPISEIIRYALQRVEEIADKHGITISVDVDPQNMM